MKVHTKRESEQRRSVVLGSARSNTQEEPEHPPRWLSVAAVSGLVGLLSGAIGLAFVVRPALKPDPGERQVAEAKVVAVERGVAVSDYARRVRQDVPNSIQPTADLIRALKQPETDDIIKKCIPGDVYYVQQNLQGFKDRSTSIVLYTYSAATGLRLKGAFPTVSSSGTPTFQTKHSRTIDQSVVPIWAQWPFRSGKFFVRFEVFHNKEFLALANGRPFRMTRLRYINALDACFVSQLSPHITDISPG